jgi:hypothetical protein
MKRLIAAALLVLMVVAVRGQSSNTVYSPNIVGFLKVDVPGSNKITMVAVPFEPVNSNGVYTLDEVLGTNFTAHWSAAVADQVWMWNSFAQHYSQAFLNNDGWGDTNVDWKWCYMGLDGNPYPCAQTNLFDLTPATGFFINNKHGDVTLYLTGQAPTSTSTAVGLAGLQMVAYPYPVPQPLATLLTTNDGATANWSTSRADELWLWNTANKNYDTFFLNDDGWGDTNVNWKWCAMGLDGNPYAATNTLQPGMGFFYKAKGSNFNWNVVRPYPLN